MSKKIVVKLISTVMAMTMAIGSSMAVFAAAPPNGIKPDSENNLCDSNHDFSDTSGCYYNNNSFISSSIDSCVWSCARHRSDTKIAHTPGTTCEYCGIVTPPCSTSSSSSGPAKPTAEQLAEEAYNAAYGEIEATMSKEAALPVATFTSEGAVNAIPVEAKATGAAYNLSSVTTPQGFAAAVNKLSADTTNATLAVYSSKMITFTSELLDEIEKTGKTFEYTFELEGHIYKITIPAGAKVDMDGQRFVGPLYIGAQLGTSQVIK